MITTDSFLRIGKHPICEDYIISGYDTYPHVILADGCSSSENTDLGARNLVHSAKLNIDIGISDIGRLSIHTAKLVHDFLNLKNESLDATLIVAYVKDDFINIIAYGDGVIIFVDIEGNIYFEEISYNNNAPYYLNYTTDSIRNDLYVKCNNKKFINNITEYDVFSPIEYKLPVVGFKSVLISSDGISSFMSNEKGSIDTKDVVEEIVDFKNTTGKFIQRRCNKMIKNYEKDGYFHYDDLSIGGFFIDDSLRERKIE